MACPKAPNPIWVQHKQSKFNRTSESILRLLVVSDSKDQKHLYLTWDDLHIWPESWLFQGCGHAPTAANNHSQMFLIGQVSSCLLGVGWSLILQQHGLQCYREEGLRGCERGTQRKHSNLTEGPVVRCGENRHGKVASAVEKNSLETTQHLYPDPLAS